MPNGNVAALRLQPVASRESELPFRRPTDLTHMESGHDRHAGGAESRKEAADEAYRQREHDALGDQGWAEPEAEDDLCESSTECGGGEPIEDEEGFTAPTLPPIVASRSDSIRVPTNAGNPPKPMARSAEISVARAATDESMVLMAPASCRGVRVGETAAVVRPAPAERSSASEQTVRPSAHPGVRPLD